MDSFQKDVITIIKAAALDEKHELSPDFDLEKAVKLAKKHGVGAMFYYGLRNCGVDNTSDIMQRLLASTMRDVAVNEKQMYAVREIFDAFENAGIEYMPLKGVLLKGFYRAPEMRSMGDADILIKTEQYGQIKPIMQELGFEEKVESDHEFVWNKPGICIELHKRLIPSYNKDFYAYFGDGWKLAKVKNGSRYEMTDEDQMIYLFTHYAKHYRDAGIGIRHIVDLWVYRNNHLKLDEDYIEEELKKLSLYDFYLNTVKTLDCWFGGRESNPVTDFITTTIFNSGVYGTEESHILFEAVKLSKTCGSENVQRRKYLSFLFPKLSDMCKRYPFLSKVPVLLPVMWVVRLFTAILFRRENVKKQQERVSKMSSESVDAYQQALELVGLDFDFKE